MDGGESVIGGVHTHAATHRAVLPNKRPIRTLSGLPTMLGTES